ncbi:MAG: hypothetical protein IRY97_09765, partial [Thermomicrobiaceae bacterium]|nr:hypothetical protein [Thermomicrobiaceae bacterium]
MKQVLLLVVAVLIGVSLLPIDRTDRTSFASPAFQRLWSMQSAAAAGTVDLWGSEPLLWRVEPYLEAPDGRRLVQYFDRGRMELTAGRDSGPPSITQGLLAQELTTGQIHLGHTLLAPRPPAEIAIDGGPLDDRVPTYAALGKVVNHPAVDRAAGREPLRAWIDGRGE